YLSRFRLLVNDRRPLLLSARVKDENELFGVDLTNPDIPVGADGRTLPRDLVHIFRARFLWSGAWHECLRLWNYGPTTVDLSLAFEYEADFADIFEVRGMTRSRRGTRLETERSGATMRLGYRGLDDARRSTVFEWSKAPRLLTDTLARFDVALQPQTPATLSVAIRCEPDST